jgi:hypothetical protein
MLLLADHSLLTKEKNFKENESFFGAGIFTGYFLPADHEVFGKILPIV